MVWWDMVLLGQTTEQTPPCMLGSLERLTDHCKSKYYSSASDDCAVFVLM